MARKKAQETEVIFPSLHLNRNSEVVAVNIIVYLFAGMLIL